MQYKFKVGDQVQIKEHFDDFRYEYDPGIDDDMLTYSGGIYTVRALEEYYSLPMYRLEGNTYLWDERWLEPVNESLIDVNEDDWLAVLEGK